jgi:hypothetical protein
MKQCTYCRAMNNDEVMRCLKCGNSTFIIGRPSQSRSKPGARRPAPVFNLPLRYVVSLMVVCGLGLILETAWCRGQLSRRAAEVSRAEAEAATQRAVEVARQEKTFQGELDYLQQRYLTSLGDSNVLSGAAARQLHEAEWILRQAHNPALARTLLETNLLVMEQMGSDATLNAQLVLERVAQLSAPPGSRVEVAGDTNGFRVRVAFMMSRLREHEAGAVTESHTTSELRAAIEDVSAQVLRDLYGYCGSRGIQSISVTCNHTARLRWIPVNATPDEKKLLWGEASEKRIRFYRVRLDQPETRAIVSWRQASLPEVSRLWTVEYDGLENLTITPDFWRSEDPHDPAGELQF